MSNTNRNKEADKKFSKILLELYRKNDEKRDELFAKIYDLKNEDRQLFINTLGNANANNNSINQEVAQLAKDIKAFLRPQRPQRPPSPAKTTAGSKPTVSPSRPKSQEVTNSPKESVAKSRRHSASNRVEHNNKPPTYRGA